MSVHVESIEKMCIALETLGQGYRNDWSEVDGRTIRSQLDDASKHISKALNGEDVTEYANYLIEKEWNYDYDWRTE